MSLLIRQTLPCTTALASSRALHWSARHGAGLRLGLLPPQSTPAALHASPTTTTSSVTRSLQLQQSARRLYSSESAAVAQLRRLREEAEADPEDPKKHLAYLKELVVRRPDLVVNHYPSIGLAKDAATAAEYARATSLVAARTKGVQSSPLSYGPDSAMASADSYIFARPASSSRALGSYDNPVHVKPKQSMWPILLNLIIVALVGVMLYMALPKASGIMGKADLKPQSNVKARFNDVKGCDEAKQELMDVVSYLKNPQKMATLGGKLPKGLLLTGPPGTGKTLLAKAVAGEAGVPFFYASGSEFEEVYVGVGAKRIRELFAAARKAGPCLIFIDEIDAVGGTRKLKEQGAMRMTLNQLLVEMDGFTDSTGIIVIGATNFPELLDHALMRPGRFDRQVVVPLPDVRGRMQILELYLSKIKAAPDINIETLARATPGSSGADLFNIVNLAAVRAAMRDKPIVTMSELEYAREKVQMGSERLSALIDPQQKRLTAFHEGGHALVALFTPGAMAVHTLTIIPRGNALGYLLMLPNIKQETSQTKQELQARMDVCMGGRVAEELIFGPDYVTSGAASDISQATNIAYAMVNSYGMSEAGFRDYTDPERKAISQKARARTDEEVQKLLDASYSRAKALLTAKKKELERLADALLKHETLNEKQIRAALSGAPVIPQE